MKMLPAVFYATMSKYAIQVSKLVYIQPSVLLVQWANETGYGASSGWKYHSIGNIKYVGKTPFDSGYFTIPCDVAGGNCNYYKYANWTNGAKGYANFINTNSRYNKVKHLKTYIDTCRALGRSGFAESGYRYGSVKEGWHGEFGQVLVDMIEKNNLTKYDKNYLYNGKAVAPPIKTVPPKKPVPPKTVAPTPTPTKKTPKITPTTPTTPKITPTPKTPATVLKSGISLFGLIFFTVILKNAFIEKSTCGCEDAQI